MKEINLKLTTVEATKLIAVCNAVIESERDCLESLKMSNCEPHVRQMTDNSITFIQAIKAKIKSAMAERK